MTRRVTLVAAVAYLAYAMFLTWPLALDLGSRISAPGVGGDLSGAIGHTQQVVDGDVFPFAPARLPDLDAPEGLEEDWVLNWATLPGTAALYGLSFIFGAVAGHGLFLLLGFVLSGTAMFLFTRKLFDSTPAAFLAGFVFAFYPFAVGKTEAHLHFVHGWVLVLLVWRMLEVIREPSRRNALLGGLATALAIWFTPYFILIGGVAFGVFAVAAVLAAKARGELRRGLAAVAWACVPPGALTAGLGALTMLASGPGAGGVRTQPIEQLYQYSARPHEFLLPDRRNLLFGDVTEPYLTSHLHGSNFSESSLYLGLTVLLLALVGLVVGLRMFLRSPQRGAADPRALAVFAGAALAATAAAFSLPPKVTVLGQLIPTPSLAVFQVTSTWRVYSRFVVLVELGLCLLLAFAVARLVARVGPGRAITRFVVVPLLGVVLLLDLWARPETRTTKFQPVDAYVWLRDNPGGAVAEYPIHPAAYPSYGPVFWQSFHGHPLMNGFAADSESESVKLELQDLADRDTPRRLAALGVKYVVVRPDAPGAAPESLRANGFAPRLERPDASVWEVVAAPAATTVSAQSGFALPEGGPNAKYRWMANEGVLEAQVRCRRCAAVVEFTASSNDVARELVARDETGRVLARFSVAVAQQREIRIPVQVRSGEARVTLSTSPPASQPAAGVDPRLLSVTVLEPRVRRLGSGTP